MVAPSVKPKILHFFPDTHSQGGIQTYLKQVLTELKARNHYELVMVCTQDSPLYHELIRRGIRVRGIRFPFRKQSLLRSLLCKPMSRTLNLFNHVCLAQILKQEQPDLVHVHDGRIEQSLIKRMGFPLVYTYHGYGHLYNIEAASSNFFRAYYRWVRPLFQGLQPYLDGMTIVSDYERQRIRREGFVSPDFPVEVIYNGVPVADLQARADQTDKNALKRAMGIPEGRPVVSFICRLAEDKNPLAFLRLAEALLKTPQLTVKPWFLVAGAGRLTPQMQQAFEPGGPLAGNGTFLGFRSDVPELLAISDLSVTTTLQEGFGLRILEQMICHCPFVSYAAGGIPEVAAAPELQKCLVPVDNEAALLEATVNLLALEVSERKVLQKVMSQQALGFDITHTINQLENFYERILQRPSLSPGFAHPIAA